MAIKFETADGKVHTVGGDDPKVKAPAVGILAKFSGIGRAEPPDVGRTKRLEARVEALEQLAAAQSKQVTALAATLKSMLESMLVNNADTVAIHKPVHADVHTVVHTKSVDKDVNSASNRKKYRREWTRDSRAAKKLGLTVAEYRSKNERPD